MSAERAGNRPEWDPLGPGTARQNDSPRRPGRSAERHLRVRMGAIGSSRERWTFSPLSRCGRGSPNCGSVLRTVRARFSPGRTYGTTGSARVSKQLVSNARTPGVWGRVYQRVEPVFVGSRAGGDRRRRI